MSFEFRSEEFTARYRVPSYVEWLQRCDMQPAYEWHRLVLQVLQRRSGQSAWVLKSPVHLHSLPILMDVYPDARVVITHRDPLAVLGSVTSLIATLRYAHSDDVDFADIGRYHADLYGRSLDHLVDLTTNGTVDPERVHHSHYSAFMTDPVATTADVFAALERPLTGDVKEAIEDHLGANPRDAKGEHVYSFADLGLDEAEARARFARYQAAFAVPDEVVR